jgi:hypothetical protein
MATSTSPAFRCVECRRPPSAEPVEIVRRRVERNRLQVPLGVELQEFLHLHHRVDVGLDLVGGLVAEPGEQDIVALSEIEGIFASQESDFLFRDSIEPLGKFRRQVDGLESLIGGGRGGRGSEYDPDKEPGLQTYAHGAPLSCRHESLSE